MIADETARFIQDGLGSVWALHLMLALREAPDRRWSAAELVGHLRASDAIVSSLLPRFRTLGLVIDLDGRWNWGPASAEIEDLCRRVAEEYALRPVSVINLIARRSDNVRLLADAFRLRKE